MLSHSEKMERLKKQREQEWARSYEHEQEAEIRNDIAEAKAKRGESRFMKGIKAVANDINKATTSTPSSGNKKKKSREMWIGDTRVI